MPRELITISPNNSPLIGCKCGGCGWGASVHMNEVQVTFDAHRCEDYPKESEQTEPEYVDAWESNGYIEATCPLCKIAIRITKSEKISTKHRAEKSLDYQFEEHERKEHPGKRGE